MLSVMSVYGTPPACQLPGRKPGPLQQRPGFIHEHVYVFPLKMGLVQDPKRRAVVDRCERAGLAVVQHGSAVRYQRGSEFAQYAVPFRVVRFDSPGPVVHRRQNAFHARPFRSAGGLAHLFNAPKKIHCRRPRRAHLLANGVDSAQQRVFVARVEILGPQQHGVGRGYAERRSAPDTQGLDRLANLIQLAARDNFL